MNMVWYCIIPRKSVLSSHYCSSYSRFSYAKYGCDFACMFQGVIAKKPIDSD